MTALDWLTVATSFATLAINAQLLVRPALLAWRPPTVRIAAVITMALAALTIVLTFNHSH